jgi:sarcosine oxidase subunit alpha
VSATVDIVANGRRETVASGTSVAAALLNLGVGTFRTAAGGEGRGPLCGMGVCYECRVTIDGVPHRRACLVPVAAGMRVTTGGESEG